ncbi:MAG TPA: alpha-(1-_3)-arabinofuranosyltransferase family protein, partial [Acidimicrobiales bacterium]|nr:alpha-(1->3)-arabinofuranosyltransferase family protein [Acidimicrobiales bacterium]
GWMARTWDLWQPLSHLGFVQNQAVGYLFPMGPFFLAGHALGVDPWVAQRLWIGLVFVVGFWGMTRLADELQIGMRPARLLAGLSYALSPLFAARAGNTSGLVMGGAMLPWILIPLVRATKGGSLRRCACASGLAIVAIGGINAAVAHAVLISPAVWILTRRRGRERRILATWWVVAGGMAVAWWFLPLVFQSRFGFNFLAYTERSSITTSYAPNVEILRGVADWLQYLHLREPWIASGWALVSGAVPIVATGGVAAAGVWGLCRRDLPHRLFLVVSFAIGVAVMGAGYGTLLGNPAAPLVRQALGGVAGPFRNIYKFQPVVLLPLALSSAHTLTLGLRWLSDRRLPHRWTAVVGVGAALAVVGLGATPFWSNKLVSTKGFAAIPSWWGQFAHWQSKLPPNSRVLIVPGVSTADYTWGRPLDEPIDVLATRPYAVRDLVPQGSPEETRVLDTVETAIANGGDPGLPAFLARAGFSAVVARNDLNWREWSEPRPSEVHRALVTSGLVPSTTFGPSLPLPGSTSTDTGAGDAESGLHALEVWQVPNSTGLVASYPANDAVVVSGGPESIIPLQNQGLLGSRPVVLAGDADPTSLPSSWVMTDQLRRRAIDPGLTHANQSYTLAAGADAAGGRKVDVPFLSFLASGHEALSQLQGNITDVTASSYGSWLLQLPETQPANAIDGDPSTAWVAGPSRSSKGQWVQVSLRAPIDPRYIDIQLLEDGPWRPLITALRVTTAHGSQTSSVRPDQTVQRIAVPPGPASWIRVTLADVKAESPQKAGAGIRSLTIPGATGRAAIQLPSEFATQWSTPGHTPPTFSFVRSTVNPRDPLRSDEEPTMQRLFSVPTGAGYVATANAVARPGTALLAFLDRVQSLADQAARDPNSSAAGSLEVSASSTYLDLPEYRAANVLSDNPLQGWAPEPPAPGQVTSGSKGANTTATGPATQIAPLPATIDAAPSLSFSWTGQRVIDRLDVTIARGFSIPRRLTLVTPTATRDLAIPANGVVTFPALTTDHLQVRFADIDQRTTQSDLGPAPLPIGITKVTIPALTDLVPRPLAAGSPVHVACPDGPTMTINGTEHRFAVDTTLTAVVALQSVRLTPCDDLHAGLVTGSNQLSTGVGNGIFSINSAVLQPDAALASHPASPPRPIRVLKWGAEDRSVAIGPGAATYLTVDENFNSGWEAKLDGHRLTPFRIDGWRQAFLVPAGAAGTVVLHYAPTHAYRASLILGAGLVLLLVALALLPASLRHREIAAGTAPSLWVIAALTILIAIWVGGALAFLAPLALLLYLVPTIDRAHGRGWHRRGAIGPWVGALAMAGAAISVALHPGSFPSLHTGAFGWPAQVAATIAFLVVVSSLAASDAWRRARGSDIGRPDA